MMFLFCFSFVLFFLGRGTYDGSNPASLEKNDKLAVKRVSLQK